MRTKLSPAQADALRAFKAEVFQTLAHPTRIHIVEVLRDKELPVSALLKEIPVEAANLSQHLAILRSRRLVIARKQKNQVWYSLRDPMLIDILDTMRRYFKAHLEEALSILTEIKQSR